MQLVDIYRYLWMLIVLVLTYYQYQKYKSSVFCISSRSINKTDYLGLALCLFFSILIGLRPMRPGFSIQWADSAYYYEVYYLLLGNPFKFNIHATNLIWTNMLNFWASKDLGITSLFLIGDALYFGCTYLACKKWFPNDTLPAYLAFLGAFSTFSYSFNGVKAGIAGAVFLLGLAYYDKKWLSILLVLVSWGFHHSMRLPVCGYALTLFFKNPKWYFIGWFFCVAMSVLHISYFQSLFAGWIDEIGQGYLTVYQGDDGFGGEGGFRLDFLLYSAIPALIGFKFVIKERLCVSKTYTTLLNMYLCTNGVWCLCMYASYTNRIAYLSWIMYPFVLVYPFLNEDLIGNTFLKTDNQYKMFSKVLMYHLGFTLFMFFVYS